MLNFNNTKEDNEEDTPKASKAKRLTGADFFEEYRTQFGQLWVHWMEDKSKDYDDEDTFFADMSGDLWKFIEKMSKASWANGRIAGSSFKRNKSRK